MTDDSTHYETLGVSETAKPAAIEKAWRRATAKEGPGSSRLPQLNEAAEVLLDPARRAAYDAGLAEQRPSPEPVDEAAQNSPGSGVGRLPAAVALVLLPLLAIAAIAVAIVFTVQQRGSEAADRAATEAQAVAERSLGNLLAYDYRHLDQDRARAVAMLTPKMKKEFNKSFDLLAKGKGDTPGAALQTKTVVTAKTMATAVMDSSADEVTVLAFVNQSSAHGDQAPRTFANRVRVVLQKQGDKWLVDELDPR